jgi:hypothetical protein
MKTYTVQVNNPPKLYKSGFFPRKYTYKSHAVAAAKAAVAAGATMARVECPNGGELDFRSPSKE